MIKAVFFDVHGTLIDKGGENALEAAKKEAAKALAARYSHIDYDAYRQSWQQSILKAIELQKQQREIGFEDWYNSILKGLGIEDVNEALIAEVNAAYMSGFRPYTTVLPGAVEALQELKKDGYQLAVISNSLGPNTRIDLETTGLINYFGHVVVSSDIGWRKPHPVIFRHAMELLGVTPAESVHVGDNLKEDIQGATEAGMQVVRVQHAKELVSIFEVEKKADEEEPLLSVPTLGSLLELRALIHHPGSSKE